jgi:hypothetical protein
MSNITRPGTYEYKPDFDTYHWEGYPLPPDRVVVGTIVCTIILMAAGALTLLCSGCGATVTINVLSSHSRYGQAVGGTDTTIKGQIEGGGNAAATVPLSP